MVATRTNQNHGESAMRFMMLYKPGKEDNVPPTAEHMAAMGRYIEKMAKSGALLATDGLQSSSKGAKVQRTSDGKVTVTDGPFTETKELIAGFAIVQASSKAEAIEMAKEFLSIAGGGESEIRLMHDQPAFEAEPKLQFSREGKGQRAEPAAQA
jgi:hypothetical protein